ncbi:MAG: hypothetical protein ABJN37_13480 [Alphaproteobacteria bacterium]
MNVAAIQAEAASNPEADKEINVLTELALRKGTPLISNWKKNPTKYNQVKEYEIAMTAANTKLSDLECKK